MEIEKLKSIIESLLFASGEPVKISKLSKISGAEKPEVENAVIMLSADYSGSGRGFIILRKGEEIQLVTRPENAAFVKQLVESELQESLSPASLEVLSVVAYRGPITRMDIESIRGVNCSYTLRNLLMRGLIERNDNPKDGRGYIYNISFEFLKKIGMENVTKLPDYDNLSKDGRIDSIISG